MCRLATRYQRILNLSLIPKKDRHTSDPSNFRPVNLLGVDCKILTKTLALRLEKILPDIIHGDQVGFIKKRSSADNMRRLKHLIAYELL